LEVARRLGNPANPAPPYSTDASTANLLVRRLEELGLTVTCELEKPVWHCALAALINGARERLATGSAPTRAVAICRAVVNLPSGALSAGLG
jgi:hypothetical protein